MLKEQGEELPGKGKQGKPGDEYSGAPRTVLPSISDPRASLVRWQAILFVGIVLALVIVAVAMRLYQLGLPFDRDSYDEGVYWQSLRAMSAGHALYKEIFYSQPPFFLLSTFPGFSLFGSTLWSARLGIAVVSLVGLLGAFSLGKALSGRVGAIAALLLLVVNPLYLAQSQTLQAEASSTAFSLLAVGFVYLWWEHPEGLAGLCWAAFTGITLSLSLLCKFLTVSCIVPIVLLMIARLWQIQQKQPGTSLASIRPILVGIGAFLVTSLLVLLPFFSAYSALIQSVITFHTDAQTLPGNAQQGNISILEPSLTSLLALAALYGVVTSFIRQDWRVIPLLAWLLGIIYTLWHQAPLFTHHLVVLAPPFIALAVIGISRRGEFKELMSVLSIFVKYMPWIALLLILCTAALDARQDRQYYRLAQARSVDGLAQQEARVATDLRTAILPGQLVVTDAQFIAGLADRSTPPSLVDTSAVRINTGYLTLQQLIAASSTSQVHAVLFFTGRFHLPNVAAYHTWVAQHFRLLHAYGGGQELWVR